MDDFTLTLIFLGALFLLLSSGVWIGLALLGVGLTGMLMFTSRPAGDALFTTVWSASATWTLTALPLFIWMGEILFRTQLSTQLFRGLSPWMSPLPGRLLHTNIVGCTVFAAVSGSSAATLTTVGKMSIPELRRRGYPENMIVGTLAGASTLGLMIPPSLALIVYGVIVNESIAKLFIAGILPGLVLAALFMGYIAFWALLRPHRLPDSEPSKSFSEMLWEARYLIPVLILILTVMGSMYFGFATATEAATIGVAGALTLAAAEGSLTRKNVFDSLMGAARTSCMIALILAGSAYLALAMGFTGLPRTLAEYIGTLGLSPIALIAALTVFYIFLGCFLDGISTMVLTMAVVEPMIRAAGIDIIWFGIFVVIVIEMSQITPPVGFNLFVLQGMTHHQMGYIAISALPSFCLMILLIVILVAVPELATYLPSQMATRSGG